MKIVEDNISTDFIFNLNEGDVFESDGNYYIACTMYFIDHYREVFDVKYNCMIKYTHNLHVRVWRSENVKLVLEEVKR